MKNSTTFAIFLVVAFSLSVSLISAADAPQVPEPSLTPQPVTTPAVVVSPTETTPALTNGLALGTTNNMEALDNKHRLAIGDRLSFRIVEDLDDPMEPLDPKSLVVADSGELELPYLGRFPAAGKTCWQLAREIKAALEVDYYYQATVTLAVDLMARTRGRIYVAGAVRLGGPQEIPADEVFTLSSAILRAGGFTDYSDQKKVRITRKSAIPGEKNRVFTVDVQQIIEKGKTELDVVLEPEDLIHVPERSIRF